MERERKREDRRGEDGLVIRGVRVAQRALHLEQHRLLLHTQVGGLHEERGEQPIPISAGRGLSTERNRAEEKKQEEEEESKKERKQERGKEGEKESKGRKTSNKNLKAVSRK